MDYNSLAALRLGEKKKRKNYWRAKTPSRKESAAAEGSPFLLFKFTPLNF